MNAVDILKIVESGSYGTPANPVRSSSVKAAFWNVYFGTRAASDYKGRVNYAAAKAGEMYRRSKQ